ncbi:MAG: DUF6896 domain-containing protein [Fimbriimonas sp.]
MNGPSYRESFQPVRIECPSFAELPSVERVAQQAEVADWLVVQVPTVETVGEDGRLSDETWPARERLARDLAPLLPAHKVWDSGFRPHDPLLLVTKRREPGSHLDGVARVTIRRVITEAAFEVRLDGLTAAAEEYRALTNVLMRRLARQLGVDVSEFAADADWHRHEQIGQIPDSGGAWDYFFHGCDCAFRSVATGVTVEARLGYARFCGGDFGVYDPGFFMEFVNSSVSARPEYLPVAQLLQDWYENARRALEFLERHGVLRRLASEAGIGGGWVIARGDGG